MVSTIVYKRDVRVALSYVGRPPQRRDSIRSAIIHFSKRSAKRLRHIIRNSEDEWKAFITLTYPAEFPCDGRETKKHLNAFLQFLRRQKLKNVWILEFQERGAPHYHIIVNGFIHKDKLAERWYKIVDSGDEKHLQAGTRIEAIRSKQHLYRYLSNYINKLDQKTVPMQFENVGRFWGTSRNILEFVIHHFKSSYDVVTRSIRPLRKWYRSHVRGWAKGWKWKWQGQGFTAYDGASFVNRLRSVNVA
jgi:hypothetical protein